MGKDPSQASAEGVDWNRYELTYVTEDRAASETEPWAVVVVGFSDLFDAWLTGDEMFELTDDHPIGVRDLELGHYWFFEEKLEDMEDDVWN